jgi:hypothetical protein
MQNSLNLEGVEQQSLKEYTEKAYLRSATGSSRFSGVSSTR